MNDHGGGGGGGSDSGGGGGFGGGHHGGGDFGGGHSHGGHGHGSHHGGGAGPGFGLGPGQYHRADGSWDGPDSAYDGFPGRRRPRRRAVGLTLRLVNLAFFALVFYIIWTITSSH